MKYALAGFLIIIGGIGLTLMSSGYFDKTFGTQYILNNPGPGVAAVKSNLGTSLLFVGDIMLGRHVETLMRQHGQDYPFLTIDSLLITADAVIGNLEGPIVKDHVQTPDKGFGFNFSNTTAAVLADHKINIVNLANNHTYDYGKSSYDYTIAVLKDVGVDSFGNPFDFGNQYVLRKKIHDRSFIFAGFNITNPNFNYNKSIEFIKTIQKISNETLVIISHGGVEYELHSNKTQQSFYRQAIEAGADLVIAHHPHVVQEIEEYKGRLIFYSLGNFIFDQYFSKDVQEGLAVQIIFGDKNTIYKLIPLQSSQSQPAIMDDMDKKAWLASLASRSSPSLKAEIENSSIER